MIGGAHDDVALDDVVEPLLEIGLVDAYSMMVACLIVEPHDGDIDVMLYDGDGGAHDDGFGAMMFHYDHDGDIDVMSPCLL